MQTYRAAERVLLEARRMSFNGRRNPVGTGHGRFAREEL